nr:asparaginase [Roseococcus sp. MDT2-1-1]
MIAERSVNQSDKKRIAFIGTGGTIASLGEGPFDIQDYGRHGTVMEAAALLARWPEAAGVAAVEPIAFRAVPSTAIGPADWLELRRLVDAVAARGVDGIVIGHGTATLEETAYFLHLTAQGGKQPPVALVGAQRPSSALSSDAGMNLANACRVAGDPGARGLGVLVAMNDEIHAAREVTKTHTARLQAFQSPDFGALGLAEADAVHWYRRPLRPPGNFDLSGLAALPRVDIVPCYAGADGVAVEAFLRAGAEGLVLDGFAPSGGTPALMEALRDAPVPVAATTRAGGGRVVETTRSRAAGLIPADNLNAAKARVLLMLGLTRTRDRAELRALFDAY